MDILFMETLPTVQSAAVFSKRIEHHCVSGGKVRGKYILVMGNRLQSILQKATMILPEKSSSVNNIEDRIIIMATLRKYNSIWGLDSEYESVTRITTTNIWPALTILPWSCATASRRHHYPCRGHLKSHVWWSQNNDAHTESLLVVEAVGKAPARN